MLDVVEGAFLTGNANKRAWLRMQAPSPEELELAAERIQIPMAFLLRRLEGKPARPFVQEEGFLAFQFLVPHHHHPGSSTFDLLPFTLILLPGYLVTMSQQPIALLDQLIRPESPRKRWELVLQLIHQVAQRYVRMSRDVSQELRRVEDDLRQAQRVAVIYRALDVHDRLLELDLGLLQLEHLLLAMRPWVPKDSEELRELLEDSGIELRQARDAVDIEQETINGLLNAYTYVVNNNVNHVFKFMAALIILATIPLFIPGAAAMNVPLGNFPHWKYGFDTVTSGLILVELITGWVFYRIGWLRLQ